MGLLTLFAGAIVLDRLGAANGDAISSLAYVYVVGVVTLQVYGRGSRRRPIWATLTASLVPYAALHLLIVGLPDEGLSWYVLATELAFLTLATMLGRHIANALAEIEETIGSVAFGEAPAIDLDGPQAANEILSEMARSRRHDRPLSVTVFEPDVRSLETAVEQAAEDVQRAIRRRYVYGRLARLIADQLRRSDLLFEHTGTGRFVVLSPETETDGTELLVNRIRQAAKGIDLDLAAGSATFPDQALTFEQLVLEAERRLAEGPAVPHLRPVAEPVRGSS